MDEEMVTKVNSRCYRFPEVDFEPESRSLYWRDSAVTTLTYEECRLLEMLCYHAGEVISARVLYTATSLPDSSFSQHQNTLCSLLSKSYHQGHKVLPLDVVGDYGYRISLPQKTYQREAEAVPDPSTPDVLDIYIDEPMLEPPAKTSYIPKVLMSAVAAVTLSIGAYLYII
ncbi:hypothetical protein [Enterovibrio norvegicus]|uniref:OmpR/PhoB-type domain-containing protein n=2 Tax=Enterovibrio norvegicus TaxID=188144 RepID=A0A1I5RB86_9GAMM|nr:hypothetical protein [Enterovibrio norvegicus]MCC4798926.1 hypothetical protein [Enterovibrio norvegicus]OEE62683.1 hypothetical protein A1OS_17945 [Enterovibrio norvegicus]OEF53022.1 hypothetical protein A1OW_07460 [Enterovibrio norvegicus]PMH72741.1 hypothetical protein BCU62_00530 [Enterovibrio norvegicus]PMI31948.1 hypothetical protein BCU47_13900 [Enterovibrio norvegicus]